MACLFLHFCKNNDFVLNDNKIKTQTYVVYKNFPSKYVSTRDIEVWLPSNYEEASSLPVLYMFDGQNIFHGKKGWFSNKYNHGWQVDDTLDSLFLIEKAPKMIVVGIPLRLNFFANVIGLSK